MDGGPARGGVVRAGPDAACDPREVLSAPASSRARAIIRDAAAAAAGIPPLEVAFRWLVHHSALRGSEEGDGVVVVGFSTLGAAGGQTWMRWRRGPLDGEVLGALERAWRAARVDAGEYWQMPLVYGYDTREALFGKTGSWGLGICP